MIPYVVCDLMEIHLKTLTPLWTGDIEGKCTKIKETGIIGSLRWWYEALVRGLGGYACDPTDSECEFNYNAYRETKNVENGLKDVCEACRLFGCTGWRKKFKLEINPEDRYSYAPFVIAKPKSSKKQAFLGYYDNTGRTYEKNGGIFGKLKVDITAQKEDIEGIIDCTLQLSADWGLGAIVQRGFGISSLKREPKSYKKELPKFLEFPKKVSYSLPLPQIDHFFFYRIPIRDGHVDTIRSEIGKNVYKTMKAVKSGESLRWPHEQKYPYIPSAPWVRRSIRRLFSNNDVLRHYLMGFVSVKGTPRPVHLKCWQHLIDNDRKNRGKYWCHNCQEGGITEEKILKKVASKINVSHMYDKKFYSNEKESKWEMKIWGWIPDIPNKLNTSRENIQKILKEKLKNENFWKQCFNVNSCPVDIDKIKWVYDPDPKKILRSGGKVSREMC